MISTKDRSYYIGASDTKFVIGNWETKTFEKWWLTKIGVNKNSFQNEYTLAGTHWEHKILDFIDAEQRDLQKIKGRLRVNIDGYTQKKIQEVKTYIYEKGYKVSKDYKNQCLVEMYCFDTKECEIVFYGLIKEDYNNYFRNVDENRISIVKIEYDKKWIEEIYLPRLNYLTKCLEVGKFPILRYLGEEF